ncbi:hypothetical protein ACFT38_45870 [Streptomyces sp. NPDC056975]|uniref:hypothetical protein n=1 Tax=Streptomyces sp. NPDC056975 TaxID=3345985 RepID=UPI003624D6A5
MTTTRPAESRKRTNWSSPAQRDADERIYVVTTNLVIDAQEKLARCQQLDRIWRAGAAVSWLSLLTSRPT